MTDSQFSLQPNWQTAATIISMVLENPDARMTSKDDARKEMMRMAALLDKLIKERGKLSLRFCMVDPHAALVDKLIEEKGED
tara:strand:- start:2843 stop:3088 length:246 start_codon:yes stop_codon:yes gene_type:complete